jgi:endonuclease-3 related protein
MRDLIYHLVSLIPKGKVLTYGQIANVLGLKSARIVGFFLHQNKNSKEIPCHRVVFKDGSLSKNYAFGGEKQQFLKLKKEKVKFYLLHDRIKDRIAKVNLNKSLWEVNEVLKKYFFLLKKHGFPGTWPWFKEGKKATREEIIISSILTQNTNWKNAEKALDNLRKEKLNHLEFVYKLGKNNLDYLKKLIRPAGFYNQKAERIFSLCKTLIEDYKNWRSFFKLPLFKAREKLLKIKGIGKETADTILLYVANKPIFVIDNYTILFVKKFFKQEIYLSDNSNKLYDKLQSFFMKNLPRNRVVFQNYHALIVRWGKEDKDNKII